MMNVEVLVTSSLKSVVGSFGLIYKPIARKFRVSKVRQASETAALSAAHSDRNMGAVILSPTFHSAYQHCDNAGSLAEQLQ